MSDIFENLIPTGASEETIDVTKNYREELVGEGKKYSDDEALARAAMEKELHIRKLERENAALRQTTAAQQKLEDLVTKLSSQTPPPVQGEQLEHRGETAQTPEQLEETVMSLLAKRDAESRQASNVQRAGEALLKQFGPNYNVHLNSVAAQLGMPRANLDQLAAQSPEAFLKLVGVQQRETDRAISPPQTSVTTQDRPAVKGEKTRSYYRNLMKTNRDLFLTPAIQNEMHENAFRLGAAFDA